MQRRRDAEIAQLRDALAHLMDVATAVQSYVWFVDKDIRLPASIPEEDFKKTGDFFKNAVFAAQRLRAIARIMPSDELSDLYVAVEKLIMKVVRGNQNANAPDPWHEDLRTQPDTLTRAINATTDEIKRLYETYPAELRSRLPRPAGWYHDPYQPWAQRYWDGQEWTEHTAS
ncbi:hypothetical protein B1T49_11595 [Mycobacterium persicum]|nr:hypothetical protein B1T49_11595 [Mycobacterium persicum]